MDLKTHRDFLMTSHQAKGEIEAFIKEVTTNSNQEDDWVYINTQLELILQEYLEFEESLVSHALSDYSPGNLTLNIVEAIKPHLEVGLHIVETRSQLTGQKIYKDYKKKFNQLIKTQNKLETKLKKYLNV